MAKFNVQSFYGDAQNIGLRDAILAASNNGEADVINLMADITLPEQLPFIQEDVELTIQSDGGAYTLSGDVDGNGNDEGDVRILFIQSGVVNLDNLILDGGRAQGTDGIGGGGGGAGMGGALFIDEGMVNVSNVIFSNNQAIGGSGGPGIPFSGGVGGGMGLVVPISQASSEDGQRGRGSNGFDGRGDFRIGTSGTQGGGTPGEPGKIERGGDGGNGFGGDGGDGGLDFSTGAISMGGGGGDAGGGDGGDGGYGIIGGNGGDGTGGVGGNGGNAPGEEGLGGFAGEGGRGLGGDGGNSLGFGGHGGNGGNGIGGTGGLGGFGRGVGDSDGSSRSGRGGEGEGGDGGWGGFGDGGGSGGDGFGGDGGTNGPGPDGDGGLGEGGDGGDGGFGGGGGPGGFAVGGNGIVLGSAIGGDGGYGGIGSGGGGGGGVRNLDDAIAGTGGRGSFFGGDGGEGGLNFSGAGGGGAGLGGAIFARTRSFLRLNNVTFENNQAQGGKAGNSEAVDGQGLGGAIVARNYFYQIDDLQSVISGANVTFSGNEASDTSGKTNPNGIGEGQSNDDIWGTVSSVFPYVDTLDDIDNGDFGIGDRSLREALRLISDGETITFSEKLKGQTIKLNGQSLTIDKSITIDGDLDNDGLADITIAAQNNSRVFHIEDDDINTQKNVALEGLVIQGGKTQFSGGGIYSREALTLTHSVVQNNSAGLDGGGIFGDGSVKIRYSEIKDNKAGNNGGGIGSSSFSTGSSTNRAGLIDVEFTTIANNEAGQDGGGIDSFSSKIVASNVSIIDNKAGDEGGGISSYDGTISVSNATIDNNEAEDGGGIYSFDGETEIKNVIITNNEAEDDGGGISTYSGTINLNNATISNNKAEDGGGIYNFSGITNLVDSKIIEKNTAKKYGGGLYTYSGSVILEDSTISNNFAENGGGIALNNSEDSNNEASLESKGESSISGNKAGEAGGGIFATNSIINGVIVNRKNTAEDIGGGIYSIDSEIRNSIIRDNKAFAGGGVFVKSGENNLIENSTFYLNEASEAGGGIFAEKDSSLRIINSTISKNKAFLRDKEGDVIVDQSEAVGKGGGIFVDGASLDAYHITTVLNTAAEDGGGVYTVNSNSTSFRNSIIAGNKTFDGIGKDAWGNFNSNELNLLSDLEGSTGFEDDLIVEKIDRIIETELSRDDDSQTLLHKLPPGSLAIDAIDEEANYLPFDQRGVQRPQAEDGKADIGAYETRLLEVDTLIDEDNGNLEPSDVSLREAIRVTVPGGTIHFKDDLEGEIVLKHGQLEINKPLIINGNLDENGKPKIIIDANKKSRAFKIDDGKDQVQEVVIKGLKIVNGKVSDDASRGNFDIGSGGGIFNNENLTIYNVIVEKNSAELSGGGIYSGNSSLKLISSEIKSNISQDEHSNPDASNFDPTISTGGGIYSSGDLKVENSVIEWNIASGWGGGIHSTNSAHVLGSKISNNSAGYYWVEDAEGGLTALQEFTGGGGGVYSQRELESKSPTLVVSESSLISNRASAYGAGILSRGSTKVFGSSILNNFSNEFGGGISHYSSDDYLVIFNSTVGDNNAREAGGIDAILAEILFSTIVENRSVSGAGGVLSREKIRVSNTIVARNNRKPGFATDGNIELGIELNNAGEPIGVFSSGGHNLIGSGDIRGTTTSSFINGINNDKVGTSRNPIDPRLLVSENGAILPIQEDNEPTKTYRLQQGSPAINAGDISAFRVDLDGNGTLDDPPLYDQRGLGFPRVIGDAVDIGAFESSFGTKEEIEPGITPAESDGNSSVIEDGTTTDDYALALNTLPEGPVQIQISTDGQTQISIDGNSFSDSLTLTLENINPVNITIKAVDDADVEDAIHTSIITHSIISSNDPNYSDILTPIPPITVNVTDNDSSNESQLIWNPEQSTFSTNGDSSNLQLTLTRRTTNLLNEIGLFEVDDTQDTIDGIAPDDPDYLDAALSRAKVAFSALTNPPNGFTISPSRTLELDSNSHYRFYLVQNSTTDAVLSGQTPASQVILSSPQSFQVTDAGTNEFTLSWEDGSGPADFTDLVVQTQLTDQSTPYGSGLQGNPQSEILDFRNLAESEINAEFTVHREAGFDNYVGFYQISDPSGTVADALTGNQLNPGDAGYAEAAVRQRVAGIDLKTENQTTANISGLLEGGFLFAPFIIANGSPEELLDANIANDPAVYFPYLGANSDGVDHIRLLGDNLFGFEDLPGGGDLDYNDMVIGMNLTIA